MARELTRAVVEEAYEALFGFLVEESDANKKQFDEYWAADMNGWLVPGSHQLSGFWAGQDGFLDFMRYVMKISQGTFHTDYIAVLLDPEGGWSADVTHNHGLMPGADPATNSPYELMDMQVVHLLQWRDGKVVQGQGAIFGDGTSRYNQFMSQLDPQERRRQVVQLGRYEDWAKYSGS
jgi:uncharacterized protein